MSKCTKQFYEFGNFRVDAAERRLLHYGQVVSLPPKAFEMLLTLIQNSGHLLTRNELLKTIWNDTFVDENNLRQYVSLLRKTLNENGGDVIETVPRLGYRFLAQVREVSEVEDLPFEKTVESRFVVKEETTESKWRKLALILSILLIAVLIAGIVFGINRAWKTEKPAEQIVGTINAEAYENYQKGRALWQTRSGENLHKATLLLEQAVQKDPKFALAHTALADGYAFSFVNWKKAEAEANEAIRLDPNLGEPHATIGFIRMFWEWKLAEAEDEFKQSIQLNPNYATAHQWYAVNLAATRQNDGALVEITRALELEPNSISINADFCQILYFKQKYDEAIIQCQKALTMNPEFLSAHLYLYEIYSAKKMWNETVNTYSRIEELTNFIQSPQNIEKLKKAYTRGGIRAFWQAQIEKLLNPTPQPYKLAQIYARLGEKEKVLYWLNEAFKNRDFDFVYLAADPVFNRFHNNQIFSELLNHLKTR